MSYGHDHNVALRNGRQVIANGQDGVGARFDFGSNTLGGDYNFCSFMNSYISPEDTLITRGPLVKNFLIDGTLQGSKAAIYISENACVENIYICRSAQIKGKIISLWNPRIFHSVDPAAFCVRPTIHFGVLAFGDVANQHQNIYPDNSFNMEYRGDIRDDGHSLNVEIVGGRLDYDGSMTGLASFRCHSGATLQITRDLDNIHIPNPVFIGAEQCIVFEPGSGIDVNCISDYSPAENLQVLELNCPSIQADGTINYKGPSEIHHVGFNFGVYIPKVIWFDYGINQKHLCVVFLPPGVSLPEVKAKSGHVPARPPSQAPSPISPVHKPIERFDPSLHSYETVGISAITAPLSVELNDKSGDVIFERKISEVQKNNIWLSEVKNLVSKVKTPSEYTIDSQVTVFGMDRSFNDKLMLGVGFEVGSPKYSSKYADVKVEKKEVIMYGATVIPHCYVDVKFFMRGGKNSYSQSRKLGDGTRYYADYAGSQLGGGVKMSKYFDIGKKFGIKPFVSYDIIYLKVDGYKEKKKTVMDMSLELGESVTKTHRVNLGVGLEYKPTKKISIGVEFSNLSLCGDRNSEVVTKLQNGGDQQLLCPGDEQDKNSIGVSFNTGLNITKNFEIDLKYRNISGRNISNNQIAAIGTLKF